MKAIDPAAMGEVLENCTDDPEILAEFYEAAGMKEKAKEQRLKKLKQLLAENQYEAALNYGHGLLSTDELYDIARKWCEDILEERPWEALEVALRYGFKELAHKAAIRRSEDILASRGHDIDPALEIARKERKNDKDYCKRASHEAFGRFINSRNFYRLPGLVTEFRCFFNEEEVALAKKLANTEERRKAS